MVKYRKAPLVGAFCIFAFKGLAYRALALADGFS